MAEAVYSFGAWVSLRRQALVLSRDDLARQVGVAEVSIRKIEADERRPSPQVAALLAQQLQLAAESHALFVQVARGLLAVDQLPPPIPGSTRAASAAPTATLAPALLPSGTVTFLFTDIEGSTRLWEQHPQAMPGALARHDALLRASITAHGGAVVKSTGDGMHAVFARVPDALTAALVAQRALQAEPRDATGPLCVRMALHTGVAEERAGDYFGPPLNRVARLVAAGHGGQILLSLAAEQLVREHLPPDTALRDLGMHRLKDLSYPEQIFQLVAPDLPADFPPLTTLNARRTNLPTQPTALIGRDQEVAAVCALLRRDDVRLLTLTGPGGTGKTRLGLQVAAELLDAFVDGVYFVNLAPISDPSLIMSTIMQALGITETGDQPAQERLRSYLRDKQVLLLLDNFEQIVDAAPLLAELLAGCPQLKILVTSRVPLHLRGEKEIAVPPLALPPQELRTKNQEPALAPQDTILGSRFSVLGSVAVVTQYAAVQLFFQRALDIQPMFAVTNDNAPAVAEICHRLDGLPLAIELAAARIKLFAPEALLARLSNRLTLLTGGARDLPARQQTLRSAIAWSYDLLEPSEQTLFTQLGVFVGGCTQEAATVVCNGDSDQSLDVLDRLELLVDHSLLLHVDGADGEPRFVMLETIREYALERLEGRGEAEAVRQRHAEYFLALVEHVEPQLWGVEYQIWMGCIERDLDNLRAIHAWTLERGAVETALRLSTALEEFWLAYSWNEGLRWLETALAAGVACEPPPSVIIRAKALAAAGSLVIAMRDDSPKSAAAVRAQSLLEESLGLLRTVQDAHWIATVLLMLGDVVDGRGDYTKAPALIEESRMLFQHLGDEHGIATVTGKLGLMALAQGNDTLARAHLEESLRIERKMGFKPGIVRALHDLGSLAWSQGDYGLVRARYEERLAIEQASGNTLGICECLGNLGNAASWQGDYAQATILIEQGLLLAQNLGDKRYITWSLGLLGHVALAQGEYAATRMRFEECLPLLRELGNTGAIAWSLHWLGHLALTQGDYVQATALLGESLALFQDLHEQRGITYLIEGYAELALARGQSERTARLCGAVEIARETIHSTHSFPDERFRTEHLVASVRAQLDAATFDAAWAAGAALTLEQAIAEALACGSARDAE